MSSVIVTELSSTLVVTDTTPSTVVIGPITSTGAFTSLTDTPGSLVGQGGKAVVVKPDGSGLTLLEIIGGTAPTEATYTEVIWSNGLPSLIEKYENASKSLKLFSITPVFVDGFPTTVTTIDHIKVTTELTSLVFTNGELVTVTKTLI